MRPNKEKVFSVHVGLNAVPREWVRGRPYNEHLYYRRLAKKRLRRERAKVKAKVG